MTEAANARCARHPHSPASFTCPRCGSFACIECERRHSLEAVPVCPSCWALEAQTRAVPSGALQTAGLVVGLISIVPCCPLALASLAVNVIALVKSTRENRWKPIVGLCLTILFSVLQVVFMAFYGVFSKR